VRAVELIGREKSMFVDRLEVKSGPFDEMSIEDIDAIIEAVKAETARRASNAGESDDVDSSELTFLPPPLEVER
jgi:hypothetical protein